MSISEKQLAANRDNAKKSTGPKTKEGKAAIAKNAVKHGLYTNDIVINSPALKENKDEYAELLASLYDEFVPVGYFEECLVQKIANALWRYRRAIHAETAQISHQAKFVDTNPSNAEGRRKHYIEAGLKAIPHTDYSANIMRYEMRLDRQINRTYSLLMCLQARRQSNLHRDLVNGKYKNDKTNPFPIEGEGDSLLSKVIKT